MSGLSASRITKDRSRSIIPSNRSNWAAASKGRYGSPKSTQGLHAQAIKVARPRVARLVKQANLKRIIQKNYVVTTTDSKHAYPVAEHHLKRQFNAVKPGQAWVSDLTYIRAGEGCRSAPAALPDYAYGFV